jgi:DNA-directed RNA polymerase specialized sigma24 family protein
LTGQANAVFDALDALRKAHNDAMSHGREVLRSSPAGRPLNEQEWELFRDLNFLDKATITCFRKIAPSINVAFGTILYVDPTPRTCQGALDALFGIKDSNLDHIEAFLRVFRRWLDGTAEYTGKPRAYFATAVRNEARRLRRDREVDARNRLGITPRESKDLSDEDRQHHRELNATAAAYDESMGALGEPYPSPEELLIALADEEEKRIDLERKLESFRQELPVELAALFDLKVETGLSWREACRRLGLPQSKENALRNRINRFKKRLVG